MLLERKANIFFPSFRMTKSPWGKIGTWAAEAERADAEERESAVAQPPASFPSLKEAVTTAKQKKKTTMSLHEFRIQQSPHSGSAASSRGLTPEEMLSLPTGPTGRSADEMQHGKSGGGFSNYGSRAGSGAPNSGRRREYEDDGRKGNSRVSDFDQPSRADEVDNWASIKKQTLPERFRDGPAGKYSSSRADEAGNWASGKRHFPQTQQTRPSSFGSGFSRPDSDRWARNEQGFGSGFSRPEPDQWTQNGRRSVTNDVEVVQKVNRPSPFGAARPREEVLTEKGLDWKKLDSAIGVSGGSRPSSQQSRTSDVVVPLGGEGVAKEKKKVNPFGDTKPREVLLEEKGLDWKKIDLGLEHRRVERPETEEEKNLKEEIEHLKKELLTKTVEKKTSAHDLLCKREHDLELLVRQLDDNARYSQRVFERKNSTGPSVIVRPPSRPGSYDGEPRVGSLVRPPSMHGQYDEHVTPRPGSYENSRPRSQHGAYEDSTRSDRPRSRPGAYEESREVDYNERPRLQGVVNSWLRPSDDGRFYQGVGGRGFLSSREMDRPGSRW